MPALSRAEHTLTLPIRRLIQKVFTQNQIRYIAFSFSLFTCVLDASVVTFSLFTSNFIHHLKYTQVHINIISGAMLMGLYLTLPLLGYLADAHGPVLLAIIGLCLTPGYILALWVYKTRQNFWLMSLAFGLIGLGTSSSYFCSLLTCAKVFPDRKGLGISLPVTFYGLSSLVLSWVFTWPLFADDSGKLSIDKVFKGLAALYAFVGIANWFSSVVVSLEKEIVFATLLDEERAQGAYGTDTEEQHSLLDAPLVGEIAHEDKFRKFLQDPSMKLVLFALLLLAGPLELYISNLGTIVTTLGGGEFDVSFQVGVFSLFSTLTRLSMGVISDCFNTCKSSVNLIIIFGVGLSTVGFTLIAFNYTNIDLISALVGIGYGTVFTMFPTLSAMIWGVEILGSTWGLFLAAPAIGALLFGLLYAHEYDAYCPASGCLQTPFLTFSALFIMSAIFLQIGWSRYWHKRS